MVLWGLVRSLLGRRLTLKQTTISSSMDKVRVRFTDGDERMDISLRYTLPSGNSRQFNFCRPAAEDLGSTLNRMGCNINSMINKKKKKRKKNAENSDQPSEEISPEVTMSLIMGDQIVDGSLVNKDAWLKSSILKINELQYEIDHNPPKVHTVKLPECIVAGFAAMPVIDAEFVDIKTCKFRWYRQMIPKLDPLLEENGDAKENPVKKRRRSLSNAEPTYELISETLYYSPTREDIGQKLKLECIPSDGTRTGEPFEIVSKKEVASPPDFCPFEKRHELTKEVTGKESFRIVSYNILAEMYADSVYAREFLFPHCPAEYLDMAYRKLLIVKELQGYNADVICLQEVDKKLYLRTLVPVFDDFGFAGTSCMKSSDPEFNSGIEGCALFYRRSKFKLIEQYDANLTEVLKRDEELWGKLSANEALVESLNKRTTICTACVLENIDDPKKKVLVATTHFFFHPRANNQRLLQTLACMKHIEDTLNKYNQEEMSVVFCGDLNATPVNAVHTLLTKGKVKANHADWYSEGIDKFVPNLNIESPLVLKSVYGPLLYTNYVTAFSGSLDYIYIDPSKLEKVREIPVSSHEEVTEYTCLPNKVFPSDHLALVADVKWT